jgi:hypothetical protein
MWWLADVRGRARMPRSRRNGACPAVQNCRFDGVSGLDRGEMLNVRSILLAVIQVLIVIVSDQARCGDRSIVEFQKQRS